MNIVINRSNQRYVMSREVAEVHEILPLGNLSARDEGDACNSWI